MSAVHTFHVWPKTDMSGGDEATSQALSKMHALGVMASEGEEVKHIAAQGFHLSKRRFCGLRCYRLTGGGYLGWRQGWWRRRWLDRS